jgi:hypothetical protein
MTPEQIAQRMHDSAWLVDARHRTLCAQAPILGSVHSECREGHVPGSVKLFVGNLPQQRRDV